MTVSDSNHGQVGVSANVTVVVRSLSHNDLLSSTPLTLLTDSRTLVREDKVSFFYI